MRIKIIFLLKKAFACCCCCWLIQTPTRHNFLHHIKPFEPLRLANILSHIESDCSAVMIWLNRIGDWNTLSRTPRLSRIMLLGTRSWITMQDFNRNIGSFTLQIVDHSVLQHQTWLDFKYDSQESLAAFGCQIQFDGQYGSILIEKWGKARQLNSN